MASTYTLTSDLIVPEVFAEALQATLNGALRMTAFATVDRRLVGQPGDRVTLPAFGELSTDAVELTENIAQETGKLTQTSESIIVKEVGVAASVTDQAQMYGIGDSLGEARRQMALKLAHRIDADLTTALAAPHDALGTPPGGGGFDSATAPQAVGDDQSAINPDDVSEALSLLGDDAEPSAATLLVTPAAAHWMRINAKLQNAAEYAGVPITRTGVIGTIYGVPVVQSSRTGGSIADPGGGIITTGMDNDIGVLVYGKPLVLAMKALPRVEPHRVPNLRRTDVYSQVHYGVRRLNALANNVVLINFDHDA